MAAAYIDTPGPWQSLFVVAMQLLDEAAKHAGGPFHWTMGGGTGLMLRHHHRRSKDIDIFVTDPQVLGHLNPRMGGLAEDLVGRHDESATHLKLYFAEGEIDFVASPNLTEPAFEPASVMGRSVNLETAIEIVAKKMWHRGAAAKARDLFDLCLVIERDADGLRGAAPFLVRHREAFIRQITGRADILKVQFDAIDALDYKPEFETCAKGAEAFLRALPG